MNKQKILEVVCLFVKSKEELRNGSIVKHLEYCNNAKNIWNLYFPDKQLDVEEMFICCESLYYEYTGFTVLSGKREIWSAFFNKN
jgi:hypothetical protein